MLLNEAYKRQSFDNGVGYSETSNTGKKIIAVSLQVTAIAPNLTVRENLELLTGIHGYSKTEWKNNQNDSLQLFEKQKSKTLSGSWQRKLSIALALISAPDILFLDEPTLGLDILGRRELWSKIEKPKEKTKKQPLF